MKKIIILLVLIGATHSNFAMQPSNRRSSSRRSATVDEIRKSKSIAAEQRAAFRERRPSISEDVNSANKKLVEGLAKEIRDYQDLNAQAAQERHNELLGLLHGMLQTCGALEQKFDAVSARLAGVENKVTKLIESSEVLVWPEEFDDNEAPAEKSRFPFANGDQWETDGAADKTGDQNG